MFVIQLKPCSKERASILLLLSLLICMMAGFFFPDGVSAQDISENQETNTEHTQFKWEQELVSGLGRGLNYAAENTLAVIESARSIPLQLTMRKPNLEYNVPDVGSPDGFVIGLYATPLKSEFGTQKFIDFKDVNNLEKDRSAKGFSKAVDIEHPFEIGLSYGARISPNVSFILTPSYQFSLKSSDDFLASSSGQQVGLSLGLFWGTGVFLGISGFAHNVTVKERASSHDYEGFATGLDLGIAF